MNVQGLEFTKTCSACPEQYDVFYEGNKVGYVRLRHGEFRVDYPDCLEKTLLHINCNEGDGYFDDEEARLKYLNMAADALLIEMNEKSEYEYFGIRLSRFCKIPEQYYLYYRDELVGYICVRAEFLLLQAQLQHYNDHVLLEYKIENANSEFENQETREKYLTICAATMFNYMKRK